MHSDLLFIFEKIGLMKTANSIYISKVVLLFCFTLLSSSIVVANAIPPSDDQISFKKTPVVFQIGESPDLFETLSSKYNQPLITACSEDMNVAFDHWLDLFKGLERYAVENDFDINGVKVWVKVFWSADGFIDHLAFHLKPNSKNIDLKAFTILLEGFSSSYRLDLQSEQGFSHYGSASFPTMYRRIVSE